MEETLTATQIAARLAISERTVQRWIASGKLIASPVGESRFYLVDSGDIEALRPPDHEQALADRIEQLEARVKALESKIDSLLSTRSRRTREQGATPTTTSASKGLPDGLVSIPRFAAIHGIGATTVRGAINSGKIQVVRGKWVVGSAHLDTTFDQTGRRQFYELYVHYPDFRACDECPHDLPSTV